MVQIRVHNPGEENVTIATVVYERYLSSKGARRIGWFYIRKILIKLLNDPPCSVLIHGRRLQIPLSHQLPDYLEKYRFYDRLPRRISEYVHVSQGHLNCIDVGANIGDTVASFIKQASDIFLAVEPNPSFRKYLTKNWGWNKNVTIVEEMCSSGSKTGKFLVKEKDGTAALHQSEEGTQIKCRSLDEIVADHPASGSVNVLKIDTDGFDFEVIRGARRIIAQTHPVVLFECDPFSNANYVTDCLETLSFFKQSGYNFFLLYDNYGNLMGQYSLSDLAPFQNLLFYQLSAERCYFDILVMMDNDMSAFYKTEIEEFINNMPNKLLQPTAATVVELQRSTERS